MRHDPERFATFVSGAFALLYYFALAAQALRVRRETGRAPVLWGNGWGERARVAGAFLWPLPILAWAQCPECFRGIPRLGVIESWPTRLAGLLLLCLAAAIFTAATAELGEHWWLDVDPIESRSFARGGIYASIRHPLCGALWLALLGFFLLAPNLLFVLLWAAGASAAAAWAEQDDARLTALHGKAYRDYALATGKFFPLWY